MSLFPKKKCSIPLMFLCTHCHAILWK